MRRAVVFMLALVIMLVPMSTAKAYNLDYMAVQKWIESDKVQCGTINKSGTFGALTGAYRYYVDEMENCIYCYFSVQEENINSNSDVAVEVNIKNAHEEYAFSVGEKGMIETNSSISKMFDVHSKFVTYDSNNGDYIVAVGIDDDIDTNYVTFVFHTKGRYVINELKNIPVVYQKPTTTTTTTTVKVNTTDNKQKDANTTLAPSASTSVSNHNKADDKAVKKNSQTTAPYKQVYEEVRDTTSQNAKVKKSTKSKMTHQNYSKKADFTTSSSNKNNIVQSDEPDVVETTYYSSNDNDNYALNKKTLVIAIAIGVAGLVLIALGMFIKPKKEE